MKLKLQRNEGEIMAKDDIKDANNIVGDYKYGFKTDAKAVLTSGKGLSRDKVIFISQAKNEPDWMLDFRLKSYDAFLNINNPKWGPDFCRSRPQ